MPFYEYIMDQIWVCCIVFISQTRFGYIGMDIYNRPGGFNDMPILYLTKLGCASIDVYITDETWVQFYECIYNKPDLVVMAWL